MARTPQRVARNGPGPDSWDLLTTAARFTRHVDRTRLDAEFVSSLAALWRVDGVHLYQVMDGRSATARRVIALLDGRLEHQSSLTGDNDESLSCIPGATEAIASRRAVDTSGSRGAFTLTLAVYDPHGQPLRLVVLHSRCPRLRASAEALQALLALYQNHLNLIEDAELDSLTGLRNRRTFDHLLMHLLAGEPALTAQGGFRRQPRDAGRAGNWLAVLDIDRFKSINDQYGHLFGDEVLILVANLMQKSFRALDPLFRFGGEEFVVVLCGVDQAGAHAAVERFRTNLEAQTFPQVGRITISSGYTEIAEGELSSEVLNRADAALYYAKQHGRNRTCCYETLVEEGAVRALCRSTAGAIELF